MSRHFGTKTHSFFFCFFLSLNTQKEKYGSVRLVYNSIVSSCSCYFKRQIRYQHFDPAFPSPFGYRVQLYELRINFVLKQSFCLPSDTQNLRKNILRGVVKRQNFLLKDGLNIIWSVNNLVLVYHTMNKIFQNVQFCN